jgi:hypothetical protein
MEVYLRECQITDLTVFFLEGCETVETAPKVQFVTLINHSYRRLTALQE